LSEIRPCGTNGCVTPTIWITTQKNPWGKPGIRVDAYTGKPHYHNPRTGYPYADIDYEMITADRENIERAVAMKQLREERMKKYPTLKFVGRGSWECRNCGKKSDFFTMEEHTTICNVVPEVKQTKNVPAPILDKHQKTLM
jgi:hypothetical protein